MSLSRHSVAALALVLPVSLLLVLPGSRGVRAEQDPAADAPLTAVLPTDAAVTKGRLSN